jgi:DNA-binding transcriptional LysR family regulator
MEEQAIEIHQFRQLLAVAEAKSVTRAADRLGVSQPALSAGISKLEDDFGSYLFTENGAPYS